MPVSQVPHFWNAVLSVPEGRTEPTENGNGGIEERKGEEGNGSAHESCDAPSLSQRARKAGGKVYKPRA